MPRTKVYPPKEHFTDATREFRCGGCGKSIPIGTKAYRGYRIAKVGKEFLWFYDMYHYRCEDYTYEKNLPRNFNKLWRERQGETS